MAIKLQSVAETDLVYVVISVLENVDSEDGYSRLTKLLTYSTITIGITFVSGWSINLN